MQVMADLLWRHAAISVHHHDDVAGRSKKSRPERGSLPDPLLGHHLDIGPVPASGYQSRVGGVAIDKDDLVHVIGDLLEHPGYVAGLVSDRNDQAYGRILSSQGWARSLIARPAHDWCGNQDGVFNCRIRQFHWGRTVFIQSLR